MVPGDSNEAASDRSVSIDSIILHDEAFEWHDAVAIVMQLVEQLIRDREPAASLPPADRIWLHPDGSLSAFVEPHATVPPGMSIAVLLNQLLAGRAQPTQLRLVVMQAVDAVQPTSLTNLLGELARWERPNRQQKLSALSERARHIRPMAGPTVSPSPPVVSRPTADPRAAYVGSVVESQSLAPAERPNEHRGVSRPAVKIERRVAALSAVVLPLGIIVWLVVAPKPPEPLAAHALQTSLWYLPEVSAPAFLPKVKAPALLPEIKAPAFLRAPGPAAPPTTLVAPTVLAPTSAGRAVAPGDLPSVSTQTDLPPVVTAREATRAPGVPSAIADAEKEFRRAQSLLDAKQYSTASVAFERVAKMLEKDETSESTALRWKASEYAHFSRAVTSHNAAIASRLYTSGDPGVTEPAPLGPFLPAPPGRDTPASQLARLDLVIDARGQVESVRVIKLQHRFRDAWWIPAAKAWRFEPAMKDGVPVRFLKSVTIPEDFLLPR